MANTPTKTTETKDILTALQAMTQGKRAALLDRVLDTYCLNCGANLDDEGDCKDSCEDGEEEDEDDDTDSDEDEDEDEDEEEGTEEGTA